MYYPDYRTKSGQLIDFVIYDPLIEPDDRGFITIMFVALIEGEPAGYIRVGYIPLEEWENRFPTVWHWLAKWGSGYAIYLPSNWTEMSEEQIVDWLWKEIEDRHWWRTGWRTELPNKSFEERKQDVAEYLERKHVYEDMDDRFNENVDKPIVEFIRVYDPEEQRIAQPRLFPWVQKRTNWLRQHVALNLYEFAARWLAKNKQLPLYRGGIQTPAAKQAWEWMHQQGYPIHQQQYRRRHKGAYRPILMSEYLDLR